MTRLPDVMLRCGDCGRIIPAGENKFKFPAEVGTQMYCNTCGNKRIKELQADEA